MTPKQYRKRHKYGQKPPILSTSLTLVCFALGIAAWVLGMYFQLQSIPGAF